MAISGSGSFSPSLSSLRSIPISPPVQSKTLSIPRSVYIASEGATLSTESEQLSSESVSPSPLRLQLEHGSLFNLAKSRQNKALQDRSFKQSSSSEYIKVTMTAHQVQVLSAPATESNPSTNLDDVNAAFFQKAKDFLEKEKQDEALSYLNEILSFYPNFYPALEMRLIIYYHKRRFDHVISDYNKIPEHLRSLKVLKMHLKTMFEEECYAHAQLDVQSILDIEPHDLDAQKYKGAICLQLNQIDRARTYLLSAFNRNAEDHFTLLWLARMYNCIGDYTTADLVFIDPLLKKNPLDPQTLLVKAMVLINQNHLSEAKDFLSKIDASQRNREYARLIEQIAKLKQRKADTTCRCIIC